MQTQRIVELVGTATAVLGLGSFGVMQTGEVSTQQESLDRWAEQLDQANTRCDTRELRLRDECLGWIERLRPSIATNASFELYASFEPCVVLNECPTWTCEEDDQCLGCLCIENSCQQGEQYD